MSICTIVAGVDGSPASHAALRLAIDEAAVRGGTRVKIITCWSSEAHHLAFRAHDQIGDSFATALAVAQEAVDSVAASDHERSLIVTECGEGAPGPALVRLSRGATFLVVGSTSRSSVALHLGRTTVHHCLRHSEVPVVVVPLPPHDVTTIDVELHQSGTVLPL